MGSIKGRSSLTDSVDAYWLSLAMLILLRDADTGMSLALLILLRDADTGCSNTEFDGRYPDTIFLSWFLLGGVAISCLTI
jgi:hypothetical protein